MTKKRLVRVTLADQYDKRVNNLCRMATFKSKGRRDTVQKNEQRQMQGPKCRGISESVRKMCQQERNQQCQCKREVSKTSIKESIIFGRSGLKITGS